MRELLWVILSRKSPKRTVTRLFRTSFVRLTKSVRHVKVNLYVLSAFDISFFSFSLFSSLSWPFALLPGCTK